jgi:hypothetical protein
MSGPKRNPDKLNTIGVVVVGICGAVLVYVTIVALQAFYVNDTSEIQTMADYGGQDTSARSLRAEQVNRIGEYGTNAKPAAPKPNEAPKPQTYRIPVDIAMKMVVERAKTDPSFLVPQVGRSDKSTVLPIFGRPKLVPPPAPVAPAAGTGAGAGSASLPPATAPASATSAPATPGANTGANANGGTGAGSTPPATPPVAPKVPTGTGTGPAPVAGAGALGKAPPPSTPPAPSSDKTSGALRSGSAAPAPPKGNGK